MSLTLTVEFPALDRLCAWLEGHDKAGLLGEIENEIVNKIREAAESGVPRPEFREAETKPSDEAREAASEPSDEAGKAPAQAPEEALAQTTAKGQRGGKGKKPAPAEDAGKATRDAPDDVKDTDVRKALNRLIKAGKRDEVKAILKAFGAENFSKLKPDQYPAVLKKAKEAMGDD